MKLTDARLRTLTQPGRYFDGGGLYLELTAAGGRYWRAKYRAGGKEKRLAFGVYPAVSLKAARDKLAAARALLQAGQDPAQVRREAKARASQGTGVEVARTEDNRLKLNVPSDVSFDSGRADIKPQMRPVLDEIGRNLDPNVRVTIVGHTDSTGSDAINNPLSVDRAASTRSYLAARGVDGRRIAIDGMGERYPIAANESADGRARNRRVEIFVGERPRG